MKRGILFAAVFALAVAGASSASAAVIVPTVPNTYVAPAVVTNVAYRPGYVRPGIVRHYRHCGPSWHRGYRWHGHARHFHRR